MDTTITEFEWLPFVLQTADPLFPTGAYAHSLGLEELVRFGVVRDEPTLLGFLRSQILPSLERLELPFLRWAHDAAGAGDVEALCRLEAEIDAWKICRELRQASVDLGRKRLRMLEQIAPGAVLHEYATRSSAPHHLVVYGLQMARAPSRVALGAWLYQTLSGFCGASLKLIRIGPEGCQRLLTACLTEAPGTIERSLIIEREEAGWFNPLLEIAAMRHETAFERLFIS